MFLVVSRSIMRGKEPSLIRVTIIGTRAQITGRHLLDYWQTEQPHPRLPLPVTNSSPIMPEVAFKDNRLDWNRLMKGLPVPAPRITPLTMFLPEPMTCIFMVSTGLPGITTAGLHSRCGATLPPP